MKRKLKLSQKGITLVALAVTIVVLLILGGITITYVFGENGIFKLAQDVKNQTEQAKSDEQECFNNLNNKMNEYTNENRGATAPPEEKPSIENIIDKIQDVNITVEDENRNKITVPGGFKVVPDAKENDVDYTYSRNKSPCVQDGIVIEDEEKNQFVWIPVGEIKNKDGTTTTVTLGRYEFNTSNGTPILRQAAYTTEKPDNYTKMVTIDTYYQELTNNAGKNTAAKNLEDFVSKTKASGGYYLARYEASKGSDNKVKSQYDKAAWNNIVQQDAATEARNMYSSSYVESDLVNSYSWDTAIVFIQNYSGESNYANKNSVNDSILFTGKTGDKVCNIHDMASNYYEWSTEHSTLALHSDWTDNLVMRGGYCYYSKYTTGLRYTYATNNNVYSTFRPICYIK